jgi:hypothetical protein
LIIKKRKSQRLIFYPVGYLAILPKFSKLANMLPPTKCYRSKLWQLLHLQLVLSLLLLLLLSTQLPHLLFPHFQVAVVILLMQVLVSVLPLQLSVRVIVVEVLKMSDSMTANIALLARSVGGGGDGEAMMPALSMLSMQMMQQLQMAQQVQQQQQQQFQFFSSVNANADCNHAASI